MDICAEVEAVSAPRFPLLAADVSSSLDTLSNKRHVAFQPIISDHVCHDGIRELAGDYHGDVLHRVCANFYDCEQDT